MAQKFGNSRWVKEGYLDNRVAGSVVGRILFAALGPVELYLRGDCRDALAQQAFRFRNPQFVDDDLAAQVLSDFEIPQIGDVSLISVDPHPLLAPHPYIEWFSLRKNHYRIELTPQDAWILSPEEATALDQDSASIRERLAVAVETPRSRPLSSDSDWV